MIRERKSFFLFKVFEIKTIVKTFVPVYLFLEVRLLSPFWDKIKGDAKIVKRSLHVFPFE